MKNIEKEFVPYTEALELKQLGFDEPCFGGYDMETTKLYIGRDNDGHLFNLDYYELAPLYQQAFRWFREKYELNCYIDKGGSKGIYHAFVGGSEHGWLYGNNGNSPSEFTYEEAELACLKKLIEIVKQKQQ